MSSQDNSVDLDKVVAVKELKQPTTAIEVRSFLGLAIPYSRFIEKFLLIFAPLTKLARRNVKFLWTNECETVFRISRRG